MEEWIKCIQDIPENRSPKDNAALASFALSIIRNGEAVMESKG
jgi:hypothetical protein